MSKENYEKLELEVIVFDTEDVITTSDPQGQQGVDDGYGGLVS